MKYRVLGIVSMIAIVTVAFTAVTLDRNNKVNRVHQHLTARQPDAGCTCDGKELCTHLPLVLIETGGKEIPGDPVRDENGKRIGYTRAEDGEKMTTGKISVMSNDAHNHHPSDKPDLKSDIQMRIRGRSSRDFDKKGYLIRLIDKEGKHREEEMMGMGAHYEWALHGPFWDKSLMRNYLWYNIAGEIMDYAPNVRFCEVIIDGEYQGLYVMTETITQGEDCRLQISEPVDGTNDTGYVLRLDDGSDTKIKNIDTFTGYTYRTKQVLDIQYPRLGDLTPEMADAIKQDFSDFEKSLYSYDYDTDDYGYAHDIDVQSFVDYFIINEFTQNYDAGWLSTYIYKDIGGKYSMVIWDFNSTCDYYHHPIDLGEFQLQWNVWYFMLMKDEHFAKKIIDRYGELRKTYLNDAYLDNYIDETAAYLGDAIDRNYQVWGYTFDENVLEPDDRNVRNYQEATAQLKEYIEKRGTWLDKNIEVLQEFSHESKNKKFNH